MKHFIILLALAVLIVMPASALYNCSYTHVVGYFGGNAPWIFDTGVESQQEVKDMCSAVGYNPSSVTIVYGAFNAASVTVSSGYATNYVNFTISGNTTQWVSRYAQCTVGTDLIRLSDGQKSYGSGSDKVDVFYRIPINPDNCIVGTLPFQEVNFTGTPTTGSSPLSVLFTISNFTYINATGGSWAFGDGNLTTSTANPISHLYQNPGTYSVGLNFYNISGSLNSLLKTNYIVVGAPNATATTHAVARDLYTGYAINGAQVDMYDVENTSWTNTTAINGEGSITTLLGHTINIWGSATGYEDDNLIGVPAVDGGYYSLLLRPTNLTTYNSTPGNLTLAVTVQDLQIPHQTLSGAEVTAAWGAQYSSGTSNAAGSVFFTVPNNTAIHLSAFKSGYASGSSTHITGSANGGSTMETAIVYIGTDYVTPVPSVTLTTGPGGTIPQTVDPYPCIGDGSAQDTANCQRKQGSMAADLISYGPDLVKFFIMLTFIGGLLLITGKR